MCDIIQYVNRNLFWIKSKEVSYEKYLENAKKFEEHWEFQ